MNWSDGSEETPRTIIVTEDVVLTAVFAEGVGIETVENKAFLYTKNKVYETRQKLYELEEMLAEKHFLRVSKSVLLNLMKVSAIKPALNSRFTAVLLSGEQIVITRKYVPALKKALKGEG